jgi:hypothetical protein
VLLVALFGESTSPPTPPDGKDMVPKRIYRSMTAPVHKEACYGRALEPRTAADHPSPNRLKVWGKVTDPIHQEEIRCGA